jgi:hypothetical protein
MAEERLPSIKGTGTPAAPRNTFKPKLVARRKKGDTQSTPVKQEDKGESSSIGGLGKRAQRVGRPRGRREEILTASGPFAQGPAAQTASPRRVARPSVGAPGGGHGGSSGKQAGESYGGSTTAGGTLATADEDSILEQDDVLDRQKRQSLASLGASNDPWAPVSTPCISRDDVSAQAASVSPDEENTAIRKLFEADDQDGERFFTIQMPPVLPFWVPDSEDLTKTEPVKEEPGPEVVTIDERAAAATSEQEATTLSSSEKHPTKKRKKAKPVDWPPPEGQVGNINIHKSGKVTMDYGGIRMTLAAGQDVNFLQELVAIDSEEKLEAWVLGRIHNRLVATPDLDRLLFRGQ